MAGPVQAQNQDGLTSLRWMAGCWAGTLSSGALYEEWWMPEVGGMMIGMSRMLRAGRTLSFEFLRIAMNEATPVYVAQPGGGVGTHFQLASLTDGRAVFENPEHDFPQRIIYAKPGAGAPFARIEGEGGGEARGLDFPLNRVPCPGG
ncbi:MAG: DUF6265 family protein [Gemmatimonadota bacterium]